MAYVFPTPGDIPKKIFSLPRADRASFRFICASNACGSGRSGSFIQESLRQFSDRKTRSAHPPCLWCTRFASTWRPSYLEVCAGNLLPRFALLLILFCARRAELRPQLTLMFFLHFA